MKDLGLTDLHNGWYWPFLQCRTVLTRDQVTYLMPQQNEKLCDYLIKVQEYILIKTGGNTAGLGFRKPTKAVKKGPGLNLLQMFKLKFHSELKDLLLKWPGKKLDN